MTLFDRAAPSPLKPTPQGQKVLEYFEQMQKLRMELEQYCETAGQQGGPGLTVAAPSFFCTYGLPPVIAAFKERYPDWEIRLVEANDRDLVDFLRAGVAELGISANGDTAPDMESEVLRMENIILAVPAGFPVNRGLEAYVLDPVCGNEVPGVPLERFAEERFLFMKPGNDMRERGMRLCREAGFSPRIVMELDQMMTAYYLAAAEKGPPHTEGASVLCRRNRKAAIYQDRQPGNDETDPDPAKTEGRTDGAAEGVCGVSEKLGWMERQRARSLSAYDLLSPVMTAIEDLCRRSYGLICIRSRRSSRIFV